MKNICIQMHRKAWIIALMILNISLPAIAQKITITGTVTDNTGEPLIGASVLVKGTMQGTATDIDGNYRIEAAPDGTLTFSYVGYNIMDVAIDGRSVIDVVMKENSVMLNEVVAIGYGTVKKSDATGSVAVIKPDDIQAGIATSTQDLLVGASPGVVVTTNGGDPTGSATIRIRGGNSLTASNDPLVVIDGVPMTNQSNAGGTNALTMINPQDIESMTILKDASAAAIYGSRASNGVIIVTTKKGKSGRPQVSFAANFHVNTARNTLDMMNATQLRAIVAEQYGEEYAATYMGDSNTDWQDKVLRTSFSHDYNLSVAGTAGFLPYRVSLSYTDNQGILLRSGMQRTTVGMTFTPKFFDDHLSVTANLNGSYIKGLEANKAAMKNAMSFNPSRPVRYAYPTTSNVDGLHMFNGYWNQTEANGAPNPLVMQNPVQMLNEASNRSTVLQASGNLQLDYALHFLPDLHLNLNVGFQVSKNRWNSSNAENSIMAWYSQDLANSGTPGAANLNRKYELQRNTLLDFYANYHKDVESIRSTFDVMAGYSWQYFSYFGHERNYIHSEGFKVPDGAVYPAFADGTYTLEKNFDNYNLVDLPVGNKPLSRWAQHLQLLSFFGRLNYTFDDTYLLTFTLRDDASSRFSKHNRWGLFPSLALGWKIINMPFMENAAQYMNDFKLRLGWGVTGQQDLQDSFFPYLPVYINSYQQGFSYVDPSGKWIEPLYPRPYDSNIKWEETTTWNIGVDMAFLNNRFTVAADWYLRNTKDLLCNAPSAGINTSNYLRRNVGTLRNTGFEVNITARPVVTRDFTWTSGINVAYNHNKITRLTGESSQMEHNGTPDGIGTALTYYIVGEPIDTYMVYQQVYDSHGKPIPGQYVDQDNDGQITANDKIKFHSATPDWTFNWSNTFNYKNWDFGIVLRASLNNYVYNGPRMLNTQLSKLSNNTIQINNLMRGQYLFPDQSIQNLTLSSYWIEDASFIRCDNISVGYTFDNLLNNNLRLRLFGVVQNPFVITKYKGLDPEVFSGIDNDVYPRPVTFTLGLTATF